MDVEKAAVLEGMVIGARATLDALADHVRDVVPPESRRLMILKIGSAMADLIDVSRMIHDQHPILNPHREEERIAAEMRAAAASDKEDG
jgi:hypothetical protein